MTPFVLFLPPAYVDECAVNNGGCSQRCVDTEESFYCTCDKGYRLLPTSYSCKGILPTRIENIWFSCDHDHALFSPVGLLLLAEVLILLLHVRFFVSFSPSPSSPFIASINHYHIDTTPPPNTLTNTTGAAPVSVSAVIHTLVCFVLLFLCHGYYGGMLEVLLYKNDVL